MKEPSLVLNLGARSTTLLIVEGGRFVTRTLPIGVRGVVAGGNEAREILVMRLGQEVMRSLLYFRRQGSLADPVRVRLTGGGAGLAGLREALAARLQLPAEDLHVPVAVGQENQARLAETVPPPMLTDLAGAAAIRLRSGQAVMNLLPPSPRPRENRRRRFALAGAMALAVAGSVSLLPDRAPQVSRAGPVTSREVMLAPPEPGIVVPPVHQPVEIAPRVMELIEIKPDPCRLKVAGYFGEPGNYLVALLRLDQPEALLVRTGQRLDSSGLVLRSFEVRKIPADAAADGPIYEMAGFALLQDGKTGREFLLDSRQREFSDTPQAVLWIPGETQPRAVQEGDLLSDAAGTHKIERIQVNPPEIVIATRMPGQLLPELRVLLPSGAENGPATNGL